MYVYTKQVSLYVCITTTTTTVCLYYYYYYYCMFVLLLLLLLLYVCTIILLLLLLYLCTYMYIQCKQTRSRLTFLLEQSSHEEKPVSRSATLLKRQKSRGTNVNPFTPQELQSKSRTSNTRQPSSMFHRPSSKKVSTDCSSCVQDTYVQYIHMSFSGATHALLHVLQSGCCWESIGMCV